MNVLSVLTVVWTLVQPACANIQKSRIENFENENVRIYVPSSQVSVHCTHPKYGKENAITSIVVETENLLADFVYRRAWPRKECHQKRNEIEKLLRANADVTVVGSAGSEDEYERSMDERGKLSPELNRRKFKYWMFEGIFGDRGDCFGYFEHFCSERSK